MGLFPRCGEDAGEAAPRSGELAERQQGLRGSRYSSRPPPHPLPAIMNPIISLFLSHACHEAHIPRRRGAARHKAEFEPAPSPSWKTAKVPLPVQGSTAGFCSHQSPHDADDRRASCGGGCTLKTKPAFEMAAAVLPAQHTCLPTEPRRLRPPRSGRHGASDARLAGSAAAACHAAPPDHSSRHKVATLAGDAAPSVCVAGAAPLTNAPKITPAADRP